MYSAFYKQTAGFESIMVINLLVTSVQFIIYISMIQRGMVEGLHERIAEVEFGRIQI